MTVLYFWIHSLREFHLIPSAFKSLLQLMRTFVDPDGYMRETFLIEIFLIF